MKLSILKPESNPSPKRKARQGLKSEKSEPVPALLNFLSSPKIGTGIGCHRKEFSFLNFCLSVQPCFINIE